MMLLHFLKKKFSYPKYWFKIVLAFGITGLVFGSLLYFKASPDFLGGLVGTVTFLILLMVGIKIGNAAVQEARTQIAQPPFPSEKT